MTLQSSVAEYFFVVVRKQLIGKGRGESRISISCFCGMLVVAWEGVPSGDLDPVRSPRMKP